jgi:hypothetical protein
MPPAGEPLPLMPGDTPMQARHAHPEPGVDRQPPVQVQDGFVFPGQANDIIVLCCLDFLMVMVRRIIQIE